MVETKLEKRVILCVFSYPGLCGAWYQSFPTSYLTP